jgi:hypothetical protein
LKWNFTKENIFQCDNASESVIEDEMTQNEIINLKDKTDIINEEKRLEMTNDFFIQKKEIYDTLFEVRLKSENKRQKGSQIKINKKVVNNKSIVNKLTGLKTFQTTNSDILKDTAVIDASRPFTPAKVFFSDREKLAISEFKEKEIISKLMLSPNVKNQITSSNNKDIYTIFGKFSPIQHSKEKSFESKCKSVNMCIENNWKAQNKIVEILENRMNENIKAIFPIKLKDESVVLSEHNHSCLILKKNG